ncbi:MAG: ParB/RepB/Spo0J family partition protein [Nitrosotalea sp.]
MAKRYHHAIAYRLREIPIKQVKVWGDAQARKLDKNGIADLAKSIKSEGLQNPPMVQKDGANTYLLMSGQRRLAALKRLRAKKIPVLVLTKNTQYELQDAKAASVIENIHRRNMNTKDMAAACIFLADNMGKTKAAQSLGMSMSTFQKYHGFAGVPAKLKDLVPKKLSRDQATKLYLIMPNIPKALRIAHAISGLGSPARRRYLEVLAHNPKLSHKALMKKIRSLQAQQKISLNLSKGKTRGLAAQSRRQDLEPQELANKIIFDWLKKRGY